MSTDHVTIMVDGQSLRVIAGGSLAAALIQAGIRKLRESPRDRAPRGAFCLMGVCQECAIQIDGKLQQACLVSPREGMSVSLRGSS
jgi:D-hydroxyproline dehydrogenase subunit gamma